MNGSHDAATLSVVGLAISLLLPWLLGTLVISLTPSQRPRPVTLVLGHGYLIGLIVMSLLVRGFSATGIALEFWPLATCLAALSAGAMYRLIRARNTAIQWRNAAAAGLRSPVPAWVTVVTVVLCLLIGLRFYLIAQEVLLRPLFPWDAWDSWAPRTIQFFDNQALSAELASMKRPHGLFASIVHLWSMLGANSHQSPLANFPWVMCLAALCLALHGHLVQQGVRPLLALVACYMLSSMPFVNLHTLLAGYADIWLTLVFSLGVLSIVSFQRERDIVWPALTLLYALICVQTKFAGVGLAVILIACQLYVCISSVRARLTVALLAIAVISAAAVAVLTGFLTLALQLPWLGTLQVSAGELIIGDVWRRSVSPASIAGPLNQVFWVYANWHLLVVVTLGTIAACFATRRWSALARPELLAITLTLLYSFGYHVVVASRSALDHTSLSRSLIYITAITIAWIVVTLAHSERDA